MTDVFRFIIPGAPPSVNHSYRPVRTRAGGLRIAKHDTVLAYQTTVGHLVRLAKPPDWEPDGEYLRIVYEFYLKRSIDCDNAMKALNDAIAQALSLNDARFLPCVLSKSVNSKEPNPRVVVAILPYDSLSLPTIESLPSELSDTPTRP